MKQLNGRELAEFVKERQLKQVRSLRQAGHVQPRLDIIQTTDNSLIDIYVGLKQRYGSDLNVDVVVHKPSMDEVQQLIVELNQNDEVHGIIIQLPLEDSTNQREILDSVAANKDVDGLATESNFDPATPTAILWLLSGYNVDLKAKSILIIGQGPLVGAPLSKMLEESNLQVTRADKDTKDIGKLVQVADIIITAAGQPGVVSSKDLQPKAVVVDAGVAIEAGVSKGDLDLAAYDRDDLILTPQKGGVGPLTVTSLFENVLKAARSVADKY